MSDHTRSATALQAPGPFDAIPVTIQQRADLGSGPKRLYGALCSAQRMGWSPSYVDLAARLACSVRSIVRWVAQLVAAGLVACRRRGQGLVNVLAVLGLAVRSDRPADRETTASHARPGYLVKERNRSRIERAGPREPGYYSQTRYGPLRRR